MHYVGTHAIRGHFQIKQDPTMTIASCFAAVILLYFALQIVFAKVFVRGLFTMVVLSIVLGVSVSLVHYIGQQGVEFTYTAGKRDTTLNTGYSDWGGPMVVAIEMAWLSIALMVVKMNFDFVVVRDLRRLLRDMLVTYNIGTDLTAIEHEKQAMFTARSNGTTVKKMSFLGGSPRLAAQEPGGTASTGLSNIRCASIRSLPPGIERGPSTRSRTDKNVGDPNAGAGAGKVEGGAENNKLQLPSRDMNSQRSANSQVAFNNEPSVSPAGDEPLQDDLACASHTTFSFLKEHSKKKFKKDWCDGDGVLDIWNVLEVWRTDRRKTLGKDIVPRFVHNTKFGSKMDAFTIVAMNTEKNESSIAEEEAAEAEVRAADIKIWAAEAEMAPMPPAAAPVDEKVEI